MENKSFVVSQQKKVEVLINLLLFGLHVSCRVKPNIQKIGINNFSARRLAIKGHSVKHPPLAVDCWAVGR